MTNNAMNGGRHQIDTARPYRGNKVGGAERARSVLHRPVDYLWMRRSFPCTSYIVIGVFETGRIETKNLHSVVYMAQIT